jgi:hypothetical protein
LTAVLGQLDSGYTKPAEQARMTNYVSRTSFEMKDYGKAVEYGSRVMQSGAAEPDVPVIVAISLIQQSKFAEASKLVTDYTVEQERKGQVPLEQMLNVQLAAQEKLNDRAGMTDAFEKLVVHYPKPDYWHGVLTLVGRDPKATDRQRLQAYRLKLVTQTLRRCSDFGDMADRAINTAGMPGEGLRVIQAGLADKVCTEKADRDSLGGMVDSVNRQIAGDKANLGKLEAEAKASKTGALDEVLGASLFGYAEYAKSAEALSRGIGKGGLKNPVDAQLLLGIAQVQSGSKAEGVKTFQAITTEDPITQRLARLWVLYAR